MKRNWNIFKVLLAVVVIVGVSFWAFDSVRSRSYSGTDLGFDTAGGTIVITNLSDEPAAAQFIGTGSRLFRVSSTIEEVGGSSTRIETEGARTQQFGFELPPGTSEFTISRGVDVRFVADTATELQATVNPMTNESRRNALIATAVVILGALFYASNVFDHRWLNMLRPGTIAPDVPSSPSVSASESQGAAARTYGDNRADTGD
jgi:preprotein translocase subunit SecE